MGVVGATGALAATRRARRDGGCGCVDRVGGDLRPFGHGSRLLAGRTRCSDQSKADRAEKNVRGAASARVCPRRPAPGWRRVPASTRGPSRIRPVPARTRDASSEPSAFCSPLATMRIPTSTSSMPAVPVTSSTLKAVPSSTWTVAVVPPRSSTVIVVSVTAVTVPATCGRTTSIRMIENVPSSLRCWRKRIESPTARSSSRDRVAALRDLGVVGHGDRAGPAVDRLEVKVGAVDRGDLDAAEAGRCRARRAPNAPEGPEVVAERAAAAVRPRVVNGRNGVGPGFGRRGRRRRCRRRRVSCARRRTGRRTHRDGRGGEDRQAGQGHGHDLRGGRGGRSGGRTSARSRS